MSGINSIDDHNVSPNNNSLDHKQNTKIANPVHAKHIKKLSLLQAIIKKQSMHEKSVGDAAMEEKMAPQRDQAFSVTSKPKNIIKQEFKPLKLIPEVRKKTALASFVVRPKQSSDPNTSFTSRPVASNQAAESSTYENAIKAELKHRKKAEFDAEMFAEVNKVKVFESLVQDNSVKAENSLAYHILIDSKINIAEQSRLSHINQDNIARRTEFTHKKPATRDKFRTIADTIQTSIKEQQKKNLINRRKKTKPLVSVRKIMVDNLKKFRKTQALHTINQAPSVAAQIIASAHKEYMEKRRTALNKSLEYIAEVTKRRLQKDRWRQGVHNLTVAEQRKVKHALEKRILASRLQRNYKIRQEIFNHKYKKAAFAKAWMFYELKKKARARKVFMADMLTDNEINHSTRGLTHNRIDKELKALRFLEQHITPTHPIDRSI